MRPAALCAQPLPLRWPGCLATAVMARSCPGRDRDQELPVADQRAVRRVVRGGGEGDEVVAERTPAFIGERLGCLERGSVVGQEEVGEEPRRRETLPHAGRAEGQLRGTGPEQFACPLFGPPPGRRADTRW